MKATECLNTEHGVFLTQLGVLKKMLEEKASVDVLRAVTLTIATAVENHREVEERFLYPAILRTFGENFPPIQVMEAEHKEIEKYIKNINEGGNNTPKLVQAFSDLLYQHISKEINVLFPMAEQRIAPAELEEIACQCVNHYHAKAGA